MDTRTYLRITALLLCITSPGWVQAACNSSVVDVGLVTTVTVTMTGNDGKCEWTDNNPNTSSARSVAGATTALGASGRFFHTASSIGVISSSHANCDTAPLTAIACTGTAEQGDLIHDPLRECKVVRDAPALTGIQSATSVCVFSNLPL